MKEREKEGQRECAHINDLQRVLAALVFGFSARVKELDISLARLYHRAEVLEEHLGLGCRGMFEWPRSGGGFQGLEKSYRLGALSVEVVSDELGFDQQLSFDGIRPARVGDVLYLRYVGVESMRI